MKRWAGGLLVLTLVLGGCARPRLGQDLVPDHSTKVDDTPAPAAPTKPTAPAPDVKSLTLVAPADKAVVPDGNLEVKLAAPVGTTVVALAQVDGDEPKSLKSGEDAKLSGLKPGPHVLRVVAFDANGALASGPEALMVRSFTVGSQPLAFSETKLDGPMLTVGRPLGAVQLDGDVMPLDLRVDHVTLAEKGVQVRFQLDGGESHAMWEYPPQEPLSLKDVKPGPHTLKVWLEQDGKPVSNGPLTKVERKFEALSKAVQG